MKFKPITPGMVIHCPKEEDARALLEHLKSIGYYVTERTFKKLEDVYAEYGIGSCFAMREAHPMIFDCKPYVDYGSAEYFACEGKITTEFSDLIEPDLVNEPENKSVNEMSAVEVLEWLQKYNDKPEMVKVFGVGYAEDVMSVSAADYIVEEITAYEAAKKKPVEVEWGYRCCIYYNTLERDKFDIFGVTKDEAENEVRKRLKDYALKEGRVAAGEVMLACRVKDAE